MLFAKFAKFFYAMESIKYPEEEKAKKKEAEEEAKKKGEASTSSPEDSDEDLMIIEAIKVRGVVANLFRISGSNCKGIRNFRVEVLPKP